MPSTVSIPVAPTAGTPSLPVRTTPDPQGNQVFGHTALLEQGSPPVAQPIGLNNPMPVGAGSGPLLDASATVGTAPGVVLPALIGGAVRRHIEAQNVGATTIGLNFGSPATIGLGSIVLGPLGSMRFAAPAYIPSDALNAISSAAGGALTLKWA